jgi:hypothetical protein
LPFVPGERTSQLGGDAGHDFGQGVAHGGRGPIGGQGEQQRETGAALGEHPHLGQTGLAQQQIAFPVSGYGPVCGLGRSLGDVHRIGQPTRTQAGLAGTALAAQMSGELGLEAASTLHVQRAVDRFSRHPPAWIIGMVPAQLHRDLFGRPLADQQPFHPPRQPPLPAQLERLGSPRPLTGPVLGYHRPVGPVESLTVPFDLPTDRRVRTTQLASNRPQRLAISPTGLDEPTVLQRQTLPRHNTTSNHHTSGLVQ